MHLLQEKVAKLQEPFNKSQATANRIDVSQLKKNFAPCTNDEQLIPIKNPSVK